MRIWAGVSLFLIGCGEEVKVAIGEPSSEGEVVVDSDGDGYTSTEDCDDADPQIYPSAQEYCDGIDNNCNGQADEDVMTEFYADADGDGFGSDNITTEACEAPNGFVTNGSDCDDTDATAYPGASESCDGVDNDCNGAIDDQLGEVFYVDSDGDGFGNEEDVREACTLDIGLSTLAGDCDDEDSTISPNASESCNEIDDNCNGEIDEGVSLAFYADLDGDSYGDATNIVYACTLPSGYVQNTSDCNDNDSLINPAGDEYCDGVDNDCDGEVDEAFAVDAVVFYEDNDSDTFGNPDSIMTACTEPQGYVDNNDDCDDNNAVVKPGGAEYCNGYDDDCNGLVDEEGAVGGIPFYPDFDGDTYGDGDSPTVSCSQPDGFVVDSQDCNDNDDDVFPGAPELCNGEDDDCDDEPDEEAIDGPMFYLDSDGDGYGLNTSTVQACEQPDGYAQEDGDCDDANELVSPTADELCNGEDDNCNGLIDDGVLEPFSRWYLDFDGDGYGDAGESDLFCYTPQGYVDNSDDCNDNDFSVSPDGEEYCNGYDDNCDNQIDELGAIGGLLYYLDSDGDGFGAPLEEVSSCSSVEGYVLDSEDCDDNDDDVFPGAPELCNGEDDDCDDEPDEEAIDEDVFFADSDGDGFGNPTQTQSACSQPVGFVSNFGDCDDDADLVNPSGTEICNEIDDDCNGDIDDGVSGTYVLWYVDADDDGFGDPDESQLFCGIPEGFVENGFDCDDNDNDIYPNATEYCNDEDDDCDLAIDEDAVGIQTFYLDEDQDGFGVTNEAVESCFQPDDYSELSNDCDDGNELINPDIEEVWYDGIDQNCDGLSDYDQDGDGVEVEFYLDVDGLEVEHGGSDCDDQDSTALSGCALYEFISHTFTSCSVTGRTGPTYSHCLAYYSTDWHSDSDYFVIITQGIQIWTVPEDGVYRITATGASGYAVSNSYANSYGAVIQGDVQLSQGDSLQILVGQMGGGNATHGNENGGGGGSFVVMQNLNLYSPIIVAGGGGGAPSVSYSSGCNITDGNGQLGSSGGTTSCYTTALGGNNGNGGSTAGTYQGGAGGGFYSDGAHGYIHCNPSSSYPEGGQPQGGASFLNGGEGGYGYTCYSPNPHGGFGGGGSGGLGAPGGGGGYSGGGTSGHWSSYADYGGGGGSFNTGTNQSASLSSSVGDGSVHIELLD